MLNHLAVQLTSQFRVIWIVDLVDGDQLRPDRSEFWKGPSEAHPWNWGLQVHDAIGQDLAYGDASDVPLSILGGNTARRCRQ